MTDKENLFSIEKFGDLPPFKKSPEYKTIYANSTRNAISPWDIRITFGQVIEVAAPDQNINEDQVTVVMSPTQAKAFMRSFVLVIQAFEGMFGEIGDPLALIEKARAETKPKA